MGVILSFINYAETFANEQGKGQNHSACGRYGSGELIILAANSVKCASARF